MAYRVLSMIHGKAKRLPILTLCATALATVQVTEIDDTLDGTGDNAATGTSARSSNLCDGNPISNEDVIGMRPSEDAPLRPDLGYLWPLGDSITYGASSPSAPGGYRDPLYANLTERGYTFQFVGSTNGNASAALTEAGQQWHDGHSAFAIADFSFSLFDIIDYDYSGLYDEVTGWYDSFEHKPNMILLMIGTNDLNQKYENAGAPDRLNELITLLYTLDPDLRILVSSLIDADSDNSYRHNQPNDDLSTAIEAYNEAMLAMVAARRGLGQNIEFVDMHAGLTLADLSDGLHPSADGYRKMADIWADAIVGDPPSIQGIEASSGTVVLEATGAVGTSYSLWSTDNLAEDHWTLMRYESIKESPFTIIDSAQDAAPSFYRFSQTRETPEAVAQQGIDPRF